MPHIKYKVEACPLRRADPFKEVIGIGKPLFLGTRSFYSKVECTRYFKQLLKMTAPGTELQKDDQIALIRLLERHPEVEVKRGPGVKRVFVGRAAYNTKCYYAERVDGSIADFSYHVCIDRRIENSEWFVVNQAFRSAVSEEILKFKRLHIVRLPQCPGEDYLQCGRCAHLIPWRDARVDHMYPATFSKLLRTFILYHLLDAGLSIVCDHDSQELRAWIVEKDIVEKFSDFHRDNAKLRILCEPCNTKISNKML